MRRWIALLMFVAMATLVGHDFLVGQGDVREHAFVHSQKSHMASADKALCCEHQVFHAPMLLPSMPIPASHPAIFSPQWPETTLMGTQTASPPFTPPRA